MPEPDPDGGYIVEYEDGGRSLWCDVWPDGNRANRIWRMNRMALNLKYGGWRCWHCGKPIPLYRRVDARYCRKRWRKAAARFRANRKQGAPAAR